VVIASGNGKKRFRKVYLPSMCDHAFALQGAFRSCGVEAEVLPETDEEAISLGRKYVSGKECYPFAVTTGDMLKKVLSPGFDSKGSAFFMPSGTGPCRFGQYNVMQRMILDRVGFGRVPIFAPNQDVEFYKELGMVGGDFSRRSWEGVIAIDLLTKCLHETRPYEKRKGEADAAYKRGLETLARALSRSNGSGPDLTSVLSGIRKDFEEIGRGKEKKPLIGIVGEIFVRSNRFSNENLVRQVEELGGEAWLAPIDEWIYYVNWGAFKNAQLRREWKRMVQLGIKNYFQHRIAHKLESVFNGFLKTIHDPGTKDILDNASHYLHHTFRGEAVLSVGKSGDMVRRGAKGMINAMPFGCMPGTVVTSIMRGFSKEQGVPCISIPFDGSASPTMRLQLEAFMEQAAGRM